MDKHIEERLKAVEDQLKQFSEAVDALGRDLKRPVSAVRDGYYEAALTNAGSIIEAMLRDIWAKEKISGKADAKTIEQLFSVVKEQAGMDRLVVDYIRDIQLVRNRAAHGEQIVVEDCIECLRKLAVVLDWYFKKYIGSPVTPEPQSSPQLEVAHNNKKWRRIGKAATLSLPVLALLAAAMASYFRHHTGTGRRAQPAQQLKSYSYDEFKFQYWKKKLGAEPRRISICMEGAEKGPTVNEVISQIRQESGFNIFVSPAVENLKKNVSSRIFGSLNDMPWPLALELVLDSFGLGYFCENNVILIASKTDIDRFSGFDTLLIPAKNRLVEYPVEPPLDSLISGAGKSVRIDQGEGALWIVQDLPMRIDFIANCLVARGTVRQFEDLTVNMASCQQQDLPVSDLAMAPCLLRFRSIGLSDAKPVSKTFEDADIREIIKSFANDSGLSYTVSSEIPAMHTTVTMKEVQPGMGFSIICFLCGLHYRCSGGMIQVYTRDEALRYNQAKTYFTDSPSTLELAKQVPAFLSAGSGLSFNPQDKALTLSGGPADQQKLELILKYLEVIAKN